MGEGVDAEKDMANDCGGGGGMADPRMDSAVIGGGGMTVSMAAGGGMSGMLAGGGMSDNGC